MIRYNWGFMGVPKSQFCYPSNPKFYPLKSQILPPQIPNNFNPQIPNPEYFDPSNAKSQNTIKPPPIIVSVIDNYKESDYIDRYLK